MLTWAIEDYKGPVAVRYPRGTEGAYSDSLWDAEKSVALHRSGDDMTLITYGTMINPVMEAAERLAQAGIRCTVLRLLELSQIPADEILRLMPDRKTAVVIEETAANSGIKAALAWELRARCPECRVDGIDLGTGFVPHGDQKKLYSLCGLDVDSIVNDVTGVAANEK